MRVCAAVCPAQLAGAAASSSHEAGDRPIDEWSVQPWDDVPVAVAFPGGQIPGVRSSSCARAVRGAPGDADVDSGSECGDPVRCSPGGWAWCDAKSWDLVIRSSDPTRCDTITVRYLSGRVDMQKLPSRQFTAASLRCTISETRGTQSWQVQLLKCAGEMLRDDEVLTPGMELQCVLRGPMRLSDSFSRDKWRDLWSLGPCKDQRALCGVDTVVDKGMCCLALTGPRGISPVAQHKNGLFIDLGPHLRPRRLRWMVRFCRRAHRGIAVGYLSMASTIGEVIVHVNSEPQPTGLFVASRPRDLWVQIEAELEWGPEPDYGVIVTYSQDGRRLPEKSTSRAADCRYIYLFNRSDSTRDTSNNEVRFADIVLE